MTGQNVHFSDTCAIILNTFTSFLSKGVFCLEKFIGLDQVYFIQSETLPLYSDCLSTRHFLFQNKDLFSYQPGITQAGQGTEKEIMDVQCLSGQFTNYFFFFIFLTNFARLYQRQIQHFYCYFVLAKGKCNCYWQDDDYDSTPISVYDT